MKINATAYLYYNEGLSSLYSEGLWLYVKFKEEGKLFKTKIKRELVSTYDLESRCIPIPEKRINSYDEYYQLVNITIDDKESLKEKAIEMIVRHFNDKHKEDKKTNDKESIIKKINSEPKIVIELDIK